MKKKFTSLILLVAAFTAPNLSAQQTITSSGGEASGIGGSASYSTGLVSYTAIKGTGIISEGVQQPYEIQVLGNNDNKISLNITVYPNPTISFLTLRVELATRDNIRYELFDLNGRVLRRENISDINTLISMETYPVATYLLKVNSDQIELKTFKIIKN